MGPADGNHGHLCKWDFLVSNSTQEQCRPIPTILVVRCSFEHLALTRLATTSRSHNPFNMVGAMLLGELLLVVFFAVIKIVSHSCHTKDDVILWVNHLSTLIRFHIYF